MGVTVHRLAHHARRRRGLSYNKKGKAAMVQEILVHLPRVVLHGAAGPYDEIISLIGFGLVIVILVLAHRGGKEEGASGRQKETMNDRRDTTTSSKRRNKER